MPSEDKFIKVDVYESGTKVRRVISKSAYQEVTGAVEVIPEGYVQVTTTAAVGKVTVTARSTTGYMAVQWPTGETVIYGTGNILLPITSAGWKIPTEYQNSGKKVMQVFPCTYDGIYNGTISDVSAGQEAVELSKPLVVTIVSPHRTSTEDGNYFFNNTNSSNGNFATVVATSTGFAKFVKVVDGVETSLGVSSRYSPNTELIAASVADYIVKDTVPNPTEGEDVEVVYKTYPCDSEGNIAGEITSIELRGGSYARFKLIDVDASGMRNLERISGGYTTGCRVHIDRCYNITELGSNLDSNRNMLYGLQTTDLRDFDKLEYILMSFRARTTNGGAPSASFQFPKNKKIYWFSISGYSASEQMNIADTVLDLNDYMLPAALYNRQSRTEFSYVYGPIRKFVNYVSSIRAKVASPLGSGTIASLSRYCEIIDFRNSILAAGSPFPAALQTVYGSNRYYVRLFNYVGSTVMQSLKHLVLSSPGKSSILADIDSSTAGAYITIGINIAAAPNFDSVWLTNLGDTKAPVIVALTDVSFSIPNRTGLTPGTFYCKGSPAQAQALIDAGVDTYNWIVDTTTDFTEPELLPL